MNGNGGFVMLRRTDSTRYLLSRDPQAFLLLTLIAIRARWGAEEIGHYGLKIGEAFIGDYESAGMTRRQYRTAILRLERYGLISRKSTPGLGTVAKILNEWVYNITGNLSKESESCVTCDAPKYTLRQVRGAWGAGQKQALEKLTTNVVTQTDRPAVGVAPAAEAEAEW